MIPQIADQPILAEIAEIAKAYPFVSVSPSNQITMPPPEDRSQYDRNAQFWAAIFERLYASKSDVGKSVPLLTFWHQLPNVPAPASHYTGPERFFMQHPGLASTLGMKVAQRHAPGNQVEVEVHDCCLWFAPADGLTRGFISFCISNAERDRVVKPGLNWGTLMLSCLRCPHQVRVPTGTITALKLS